MEELSRLYGLNVSTDFPLHQDRPTVPGAQPDVTVRTGPVYPVSHEVPDGRILLDFSYEGERFYTAVQRLDSSYLLRFYDVCEFAITADLHDVVVHPFRGMEPGMDAVMTAGGLMAFILGRQGHTVLHASAVDLGPGAVAFIGQSGMGKSTMATLMCADGGRLITDDVLRIDYVGEKPIARLGVSEVRLRKNGDELISQFAAEVDRRVSADERDVLAMPTSDRDRVALKAVCIPAPNPDLDRLAIDRLPTKIAVFALLSFPRILGWQDPMALNESLQQATRLALSVPVLRVQVPWGPPFSSDIAPQIRRSVLDASRVPVAKTD
ncbi:MAG: hypothetical protein ACR2LI_05595 [Propionibacteriaceae bacterium]